MKYYIFAGNSSDIKQYIKDSLYSFDTVDAAVEKLEELSKDINFVSKYNYAYLVLYLGMPLVHKNRRFNNSSVLEVNLNKKYIPFIIIQRYYFSDRPIIETVKNSIILVTDGLREEFTDNLYLAKAYQSYYEKFISCKMMLRFCNNSADMDSCIIADTILSMKYSNSDESKKNWMFIISYPDWVYKTMTIEERLANCG